LFTFFFLNFDALTHFTAFSMYCRASVAGKGRGRVAYHGYSP